MTRIAPGSLKCLLLADAQGASEAGLLLSKRLDPRDVVAFGDRALLLHTSEEASEIRDWLHPAGPLLVIEFETWSGRGEAVPRDWLLARGH
jgi:hypothetical protein